MTVTACISPSPELLNFGRLWLGLEHLLLAGNDMWCGGGMHSAE